MSKIIGSFVFFLFLLLSTSLYASVTFIGNTHPITGWVEYCERVPSECEIDYNEPFFITVAPEKWNKFMIDVMTVNTEANTNIFPRTDIDKYGLIDYWTIPTINDMEGDCEDVQLYKRKRLTGLGYPHRAMRMAVVVDELGEGHAVLIIRTNFGDLVLDNKTNSVMMANNMIYTPIKMENEFGLWVRFKVGS